MACEKCNYEGQTEFFREEFKCDCGNINYITYHLCKECGWMWRELNGNVSDGSEVHFEQLSGFMDLVQESETGGYMSIDDIDDNIMNNLKKEAEKIARVQEGQTKSMADYVHRCLKCEQIVDEISPGVYRCPDCNFEWEVVRFD